MYKYELIVFWSDEDERYVVEVPYTELKTGYEKLGKLLWKFYQAVRIK